MSKDVKDWASLLPLEPNPDVLDWLRGKGELTSNVLIYKCATVRHPIEGTKSMVKVICTDCGEEWYEEKAHRDTCGRYGGAPLGYIDHNSGECVYHRESAICPWCGMTGEALHSTHIYRYGTLYDNCTVMVVELIEDRLVPIVYRYDLYVYPEGRKEIQAKRMEAYIPDGKKIISCCGYYKYFTTITMLDHWEQRKRFTVNVEHPKYIYPFSVKVVEKSTTPNCKLDLYVKSKKPNISAYMNIYVKRPNVENLVVQGLGNFLNDCFYSKSYYSPMQSIPDGYLNLKAAKPHEILGLNKEEYNVFRAEKWTVRQLNWYRQNRCLVELRDTRELFKWDIYELDELLRLIPKGYMKLFRYICKQKQQAKNIVVNIRYYRDYLDMAQENGDDITSEKVLYPQKLVNAHDYQIKRKKYKEDKELLEAFKNKAKNYEKYTFFDEELGLFVAVAKSEKELHDEGEKLHHCVGSYAKRHARGETSIFFVRKISEPDTPYYTVELSEPLHRSGKVEILQNRGYKNCDRTPDVVEFEARWTTFLSEIFKEEAKNERVGKNNPA